MASSDAGADARQAAATGGASGHTGQGLPQMQQHQQPPQPGHHQQGHQGGQQANQSLLSLHFTNDQMIRMFPLLVIGHLQQQQAIDILNAGNLTTVIMLKASNYIQAMLNVQRNYGVAVRRDGPQHTYGSLSVHLFGQTLTFLTESDQVAGKSDMQAVLQDMRDGGGRQEREKHVSSFRITKLYDQTKMRVQFQLHSDCHSEVEAGLAAIGGEIKYGVAPRGAIQRRLQEFVDLARG